MILTELKAIPKYKTMSIPKSAGEAYSPSSEDIMNAIRWYQEGGYNDINASLRGHRSTYSMSPDEMMQDHGFVMTASEAIPILDIAMREAPRRSRTIRTYRGERNVEHVTRLEHMEKGDSYVDSGFVSSSFDASYAYYAFAAVSSINVISMFIIPPTVPGMRLSAPTTDGDPEKEFLIGRNATFTLV